MKTPERRKGETKRHYCLRCHWAGCSHSAIGKKIGWSAGQVHHAIFGGK